jgi:preprotein translocase subunit SecB
MDVTLKAEKYFSLSLLAVGSFSLNIDSEKEPELKKQFVNVNAPAIMFPYIRAFITTFTASLGNVTGAIIVPTKFFKGKLDELSIDSPVPKEELNPINRELS